MPEIRVLIADDHALVRDGIRSILGDDAEVVIVGDARDGNEAVEKAKALRPDIVIMDISMPGLTGIEATRAIRAADPAIQVLGLTVHESYEYFLSMLQAGAAGYLLKKDATSAELSTALRAVRDFGVYLHPGVAKWLVRDYLAQRPGGGTRRAVDALTPRENEILMLIAEGHSNAAIAEMLEISPATVQTHRGRILQKLDLHSRADLVTYAVRRGLLDLT